MIYFVWIKYYVNCTWQFFLSREICYIKHFFRGKHFFALWLLFDKRADIDMRSTKNLVTLCAMLLFDCCMVHVSPFAHNYDLGIDFCNMLFSQNYILYQKDLGSKLGRAQDISFGLATSKLIFVKLSGSQLPNIYKLLYKIIFTLVWHNAYGTMYVTSFSSISYCSISEYWP